VVRTWALLSVGDRSWRIVCEADALTMSEVTSPTEGAPPLGDVGTMALSANGRWAAHLKGSRLRVYRISVTRGVARLTALGDRPTKLSPSKGGGGVLLAVTRHDEHARVVISTAERTHVLSVEPAAYRASAEPIECDASRAAVMVGNDLWPVQEGGVVRERHLAQLGAAGPLHTLDAAVHGDRLVIAAAGMTIGGARLHVVQLDRTRPGRLLDEVDIPVQSCPDHVCVVRAIGDTGGLLVVAAHGSRFSAHPLFGPPA
jgi:hypothetical protein